MHFKCMFKLRSRQSPLLESNIDFRLQANLCYVDIDKQSSQFPEELPVFPHKMQFIAEIRALLNKYKVPHSGK